MPRLHSSYAVEGGGRSCYGRRCDGAPLQLSGPHAVRRNRRMPLARFIDGSLTSQAARKPRPLAQLQAEAAGGAWKP